MKKIVVFDYDGTITDKDSSKVWVFSLIKCDPFILLKLSMKLAHLLITYYFTKDKQRFKNHLFYHLMSSYDDMRIDAPSTLFSKKMQAHIREAVLDRLIGYVTNDYHVIVATASSKVAVQKCMKDLGLNVEVLGFEVMPKGGLDFVSCYGVEKAMMITNYVESLNQPYEIERCFSDDLVDYHMMQLGKNRTWVISSPALKQKIINFDPFAEIIDCQEKVNYENCN